jgi:hypothetical protein
VGALALANLLPILFWARIEGWTQSSLVLFSSR